MPKTGYEFLPHTTDAYIAATGATIEEALEFAGMALFDVMCNVKSISPEITDEVEFEGHDEITLLYDWLESLLLKFELEGKVYSKFEVRHVKKLPSALHAAATVSGERYDRRRHGSKVEVKAVTFHRMEVVRKNSTTTLRFILDL